MLCNFWCVSANRHLHVECSHTYSNLCDTDPVAQRDGGLLSKMHPSLQDPSPGVGVLIPDALHESVQQLLLGAQPSACACEAHQQVETWLSCSGLSLLQVSLTWCINVTHQRLAASGHSSHSDQSRLS